MWSNLRASTTASDNPSWSPIFSAGETCVKELAHPTSSSTSPSAKDLSNKYVKVRKILQLLIQDHNHMMNHVTD